MNSKMIPLSGDFCLLRWITAIVKELFYTFWGQNAISFTIFIVYSCQGLSFTKLFPNTHTLMREIKIS